MIKSNKKENLDKKKTNLIFDKTIKKSTSSQKIDKSQQNLSKTISTFDFFPKISQKLKNHNKSKKEKYFENELKNPTQKKYYSLSEDLEILKAENIYQTSCEKYPTINILLLDISKKLKRTIKSIQRRREKLKSLSYLQIRVLVEYSNKYKGISFKRRIIFNKKEDIFVEKIDGVDIPDYEHSFLVKKINEFCEETEFSDFEDSVIKEEIDDLSKIEEDLEKIKKMKEDDFILKKNFLDYQDCMKKNEDIEIDINDNKNIFLNKSSNLFIRKLKKRIDHKINRKKIKFNKMPLF